MAITLILLTIVGAVAVALAMELTQLFGRGPQIEELPHLARKLASQDKYQPVARLFDEADARFLRTRSSSAARLGRQLRISRARVMRSYLKTFRSDFHEAWNLCRLLAPFSDDPNLGVTLVRQLLTFYGLYTSVQIQLLVHAHRPEVTDAGELLRAVKQVREIALQTLTATEDLALQGSMA